MILSVSQRTDIPKLYSTWLINRLRAQYVYVRNPYDKNTIYNLDLDPKIVDCIIFWTKDPTNIMPYLEEITNLGYTYFFHITITPYKKDIEPNDIDKKSLIDTIIKLSKLIGREKIIIRYDPIFLTDIYDINYHMRSFKKLISILGPYINYVVFNFLDIYPKMKPKMEKLKITDLDLDQRKLLITYFKETCAANNLKLYACMKHCLIDGIDIEMAKCIDGELIEQITGKILNNMTIQTKSRACNCMPYIDIGEYDTCVLNCAYCYANSHTAQTKYKHSKHLVDSPLLIGEVENEIITTHKRNVTNITDHRQTTIF